jgi:hypothetical protein
MKYSKNQFLLTNSHARRGTTKDENRSFSYKSEENIEGLFTETIPNVTPNGQVLVQNH